MILTLGLIMVLIGGSYGYKSSFILAVLPAAILYYWRAPPSALIPLAIVAICVILFGYLYFSSISDIGVAFNKMVDRLFVAQGDVSWFIWNKYINGEPLTNYHLTLLPIVGDRLFSLITGVTQANRDLWVSTHYSLMMTYVSGYSIDTILGGHNNTGTVFSEGLFAAGLFGVFVYAVFAGLMVNAVYHFIENKLEARDFAWAAVAASYFVNGVMAWLLAGGLQSIIHISIPVLLYGTHYMLSLIRGTAAADIKPSVTAPAE